VEVFWNMVRMYIILILMNTIEAFLMKEDSKFLYLLKFEIGWN